MSNIHICGATRGRYGIPRKIKVDTVFRDVEGEKAKLPKKIRCEDPLHDEKRIYFPVMECYFQKWELTEKEFQEATNNYDMFSLEMPVRMLCPKCAVRRLEHPDESVERENIKARESIKKSIETVLKELQIHLKNVCKNQLNPEDQNFEDQSSKDQNPENQDPKEPNPERYSKRELYVVEPEGIKLKY